MQYPHWGTVSREPKDNECGYSIEGTAQGLSAQVEDEWILQEAKQKV